MDQKIFEDELKRDGYDVMTNTTPGAKVNPEHSHPFDVKALVLKGAMSLTRDGKTETYKAGQTFSMPRGCIPSGRVTWAVFDDDDSPAVFLAVT